MTTTMTRATAIHSLTATPTVVGTLTVASVASVDVVAVNSSVEATLTKKGGAAFLDDDSFVISSRLVVQASRPTLR